MRRFIRNVQISFEKFDQSGNEEREGFAERQVQDLQQQYDSESTVLTLEQSNRMMQSIDAAYVAMSQDEHEERQALSKRTFELTQGYISSMLNSAAKDFFGNRHGERAMAQYYNRNLPRTDDGLPNGELYEAIYLKAQGTDATAEAYQKKLANIWVDMMNQAMDGHEDLFLNPPERDADFVRELSSGLDVAFLFKNGLSYLKEHTESFRNTENEKKINDCIARATKVYEKTDPFFDRVNRIADPLYSVVDFEQMKNFKFSTLESLDPVLTDTYKSLALNAGVHQTATFNNALHYFYNTEVTNLKHQQKRSMRKELCEHFKVKSLQELLNTHTFMDSDGLTYDIDVSRIVNNAHDENQLAIHPKTPEKLEEFIENLLAGKITDQLNDGLVMYLVPKDGKSEPVPLSAEPNGSLKSFYVGKDNLQKREDPLPPGPAPLLPWRWMVMTLLAIPEFFYWLATGKDIPYYAAREKAQDDYDAANRRLVQKNAAVVGAPEEVVNKQKELFLDAQRKELETRLPENAAFKEQAMEILNTGTPEMKETLMGLEAETLESLADNNMDLNAYLEYKITHPEPENVGPQNDSNAQPVNNEQKSEVKDSAGIAHQNRQTMDAKQRTEFEENLQSLGEEYASFRQEAIALVDSDSTNPKMKEFLLHLPAANLKYIADMPASEGQPGLAHKLNQQFGTYFASQNHLAPQSSPSVHQKNPAVQQSGLGGRGSSST